MILPVRPQPPSSVRANTTASFFQTHATRPLVRPTFSSISATHIRDIQPLFGRRPPEVRKPKLIDDDIHKLFRKAPVIALHEHQSGGSPLAVIAEQSIPRAIDTLIYQILRDNEELRPKLVKELLQQPAGRAFLRRLIPDPNPKLENPYDKMDDAGKEQVILERLTRDPLPDALDINTFPVKNLNTDELREEYRVTLEGDEGKQITSADKMNTDGSVNKKAAHGDLLSYLLTSKKINPLVKNPAAAYMAAYEFAHHVARENTRYVEYRLCPLNQQAPPEKIVQLVEKGFEFAIDELKQSRRKLDYGFIIVAERHGSNGKDTKIQKAVELAELAVKMRKEGYPIVGFDLAGGEDDHPVTEFQKAFDIIKRHNEDPDTKPEQRIGITIHAGETPTSGTLQGWESVEASLDVAKSPNTKVRIGHGIQLIRSSETLQKAFEEYLRDPDHWEEKYPREALFKSSPLLERVVREGICLEMCPKSNIQTGSVGNLNLFEQPEYSLETPSEIKYKYHPAIFLSRLGVKVAISSDNRTISNSHVTNEFIKLFKYCGATYEDIKRMVMDAGESAFIFDSKKMTETLQDLKGYFKRLECSPIHSVAFYKLRHQGEEPKFLTRLGLLVWSSMRFTFNEIKNLFSNWVETWNA